MEHYFWNSGKNEWLKANRHVSFEEVVYAIEIGQLIAILAHPNSRKYPRQKIMLVGINNYVHMVPFIKTGSSYFLKTIIPSRKYTREFLKGGIGNDETKQI